MASLWVKRLPVEGNINVEDGDKKKLWGKNITAYFSHTKTSEKD